MSNTSRIVRLLGDTITYAAKICSDYTGGGFDDWFLPSLHELKPLYDQKTLRTQYKIYSSYWTSTEEDKAGAWYIDFQDGRAGFNRKKNGMVIITVRSF